MPRRMMTRIGSLAETVKMPKEGEVYALELIDLVRGSDRGVACTKEERERIDTLIKKCENSKDWQLCDQYLYQNAEVIYVGQSVSLNANAAGGKFRGRIGRLLFQTQGLYQNLFPKEAINMVVFRLFGLIPGRVVLKGSLNPINATTVRADFESPIISLAGLLRLRVGPSSSVALTTTYLDRRIRISRGANSKAPFVFRALSADNPKANAWKHSVAQNYLNADKLGKVALVFGALGLLWHGLILRHFFPSLLFLSLALLGLRLITSTGGIVVDENLHSSLPILPPPSSTPLFAQANASSTSAPNS